MSPRPPAAPAPDPELEPGAGHPDATGAAEGLSSGGPDQPRRSSRRPRGSAKEAALRLLARRGHAREELRRKLLARGHERDEVTEALESVARYLDDGGFCAQVCAEARRSGRGRWWVRRKLAAAGVATSAVEAALEQHLPRAGEAERLARWLAERRRHADEQRWSGRPGPSGEARTPGAGRERARLARQLASRGFEPDAIEVALGRQAD